jgi:hypothetical protein
VLATCKASSVSSKSKLRLTDGSQEFRPALFVGFVRPRHLDDRAERPQGYLTVYLATDRSEDDGFLYYAHSSYAIYTIDGRLFKRVENHLSAPDETPEMVSLPIGPYIVEARSMKDGYVRRPVTINEGRGTILDPDLK